MIISRNPYTEEVLTSFNELTDKEIESKLKLADKAFQSWKLSSLEDRKTAIVRLSKVLEEKKEELGKLITLEVGRPIQDSISEIEKCVKICDYYIKNINEILAPEILKTEATESYIVCEPLGPILAIMPWNFPFTQVLRFAIPAILAGNVGLLKHASNVPQCAQAIENLFAEAGFPDGVLQNIFVSVDKIENIIRDDRIKGVTLTGSEKAGISVASIAGSEIKKTVMELGGSDPFIVLADADLEIACKAAVESRLKNAGQACNAAKRFIVMKEVAHEFVSRIAEMYEKLTVGNPMDKKTDIGPMASEKGLKDVESQVTKSLQLGARALVGGKRIDRKGYFFEPTILVNIKKGMPAYDEEIFGPVASVIIVNDIDEAIRVANDTKFGLGATIWTKNIELAKNLATKIDSGSVYINSPFNSDPRMPFGGVKKSGYGREFSYYGPREFVNVKSVWVR